MEAQPQILIITATRLSASDLRVREKNVPARKPLLSVVELEAIYKNLAPSFAVTGTKAGDLIRQIGIALGPHLPPGADYFADAQYIYVNIAGRHTNSWRSASGGVFERWVREEVNAALSSDHI